MMTVEHGTTELYIYDSQDVHTRTHFGQKQSRTSECRIQVPDDRIIHQIRPFRANVLRDFMTVELRVWDEDLFGLQKEG